MSALILLIVVLTTVWMGVDADKRDWTGNPFADAPWKWVVGGLILWIVTFPAYFLVYRKRVPLKTAPGRPAFASTADGWVPPSAAGSVPPPAARRCAACGQAARAAAASCSACGAAL
jgi:hypothetical protein